MARIPDFPSGGRRGKQSHSQHPESETARIPDFPSGGRRGKQSHSQHPESEMARIPDFPSGGRRVGGQPLLPSDPGESGIREAGRTFTACQAPRSVLNMQPLTRSSESPLLPPLHIRKLRHSGWVTLRTMDGDRMEAGTLDSASSLRK